MGSGPRGQPRMNYLEHFCDPGSAFGAPCHEVPGHCPSTTHQGRSLLCSASRSLVLTNLFRRNAQAQRPKDTLHQHTSTHCETIEGCS